MKNSIIEVIKANKKAILKKALIVGGTIAGLVIVMKMATSNESESENPEVAVETTNEEPSEV
jgi:hypothetical protein